MSTPTQAPDARAGLLADRLLRSADELAVELHRRIVSDDAFYLETTLVPAELLLESCERNLRAILTQLSGEPPRLDTARATGRMKAAHGAPLEAMLHAYRLGGRLLWERLVAEAGGEASPALLAIASQLWDIIDEYSDASAHAYREAAAEGARLDDASRRVLLDALLDGGPSGAGRLWESARALELPETGEFAVVAAEPVGGRPRDGIDGPRRRLRDRGVHSVWRDDEGQRVGLLSLPSAAALPPAVAAIGGGCRIGVSRVFTSPARAAAALEQARLACRCLPAGEAGQAGYDDAPVGLLLARVPDAGEELARQVLGPVLALRPADRDTLLDTLRTWFACAGSTSEAAQRLHYHRNTVRYRLRRLEELTGRSVSDPAAASELYVALQAVRLGASC